MEKTFKRMRDVIMTKALTILGFSSPLALMACYGTPTSDYLTEVYVEANELSHEKGDSTSLSVIAEGKWQVVSVPNFATISQDSGEGTTWITVKAAEDNLTGEYREGFIVIRDDNGEQSISICQQAMVSEE